MKYPRPKMDAARACSALDDAFGPYPDTPQPTAFGYWLQSQFEWLWHVLTGWEPGYNTQTMWSDQ